MTSRSHGRIIKFSFSSAWKSGLYVPVLNDTAVFTAAGLRSRTAASASFIVFPDSQVSSTSSTRLPVTRRGGPAITDPSFVIAEARRTGDHGPFLRDGD